MGGIEVKFQLDPITKKPTGVYFKRTKDANKLIEEYMLLANRLVAKNYQKQSIIIFIEYIILLTLIN
jgi:exoribonuclease R